MRMMITDDDERPDVRDGDVRGESLHCARTARYF